MLVDDQALIRTGIRALLDAEDDIDVVAEAANGAEAVALADRAPPDIVLMDVQMPGDGRHRGDPPDRERRPRWPTCTW